MRVFVTGATGFIGSAVVQELIGSGHQVLGLARNDAAAATLAQWGAEAHWGDLSDPESLIAGARACDGVIHTGFIHDFAHHAANAETDRRAIEAIGSGLVGTDRPFVVTSAIVVVPTGRIATEADSADMHSAGSARVPSEELALSLAAQGVRVSVVRLPPSVHGDGDHGFVPMLINIARKTGVSAYVGDGSNRWPAVHRLDAAHLFVLALEKGAAGSRFHSIAEEGVPVRDIAEVIGRRLNLPVVSKSPDEVADHFGFLRFVLGTDLTASSTRTQEVLGWKPVQAALIPDVDRSSYFDN